MRRSTVLYRERVSRILESILDYPLTIVEAPIGYGKTTAVREFLTARGCPVLWMPFLFAEDNAAFFWNRLAGEIGRVDEAAGARLKSLGFPADAPQTATVLTILNGLNLKENTVLVMDDFHLAKDPQIGSLLTKVVMEGPADLHIAVLARDLSNFPAAELCAKGLLNAVPRETLRFTPEEIRDYCGLMGFDPTSGELNAIAEYTGGWISLVYLTILGLNRGIPVGKSSAVEELVEEAVYNTYDERIRRFLLKLSVMDSFTAPQAAYVTQECCAAEWLKKLRHENAFIGYDEACQVYKIHNMLLDFLRARQPDEGERAACCLRAGEWHLKNNAYMQAYAYLYRAGETERILALLDDRNHITNDFAAFDGSFEMFAATPRMLLFKYPIAYLQFIGLMLLSGEPETAEEGEARLHELQAYWEADSSNHSGRNNRVLGEIQVIRIFASFNDFEKMVSCAREALHLFHGDISWLMKREGEATFGSPHLLYSYYKEPGKLQETASFIVKEFDAIPQMSNGCGTGCDYTVLAEYALETGGMQAAELNALKGICKANTKRQTCIALCANFVLIRMYLFQGNVLKALDLLRALRADVEKENNAICNTTLEVIEGYTYACLGRADKMPNWLRTGDMSPARFLYQGMAFNYIVYGKAVLIAKNYIQLEMLTETFCQYFAVFHNQLGFIHNQILAAAAKFCLYGMEAGCASLQAAIAMARADHILLPFWEYAPFILDMVLHIALSEPGDAYIQELSGGCRRYLVSLKHAEQGSAPLSRREIEILALAAEGMKREEVAGRLKISTGTVRTHLQHIYQKLEVNGRTAAIKKAVKLKLL